MNKLLANKQIILGVTGGIAAYKSADLARRLREAGANVRVVMTAKAKEFITPLTMQAVSGHLVHDELFDLNAEAAMGHIELARWADVILVAPATADFMARLVGGEADDLLTTLCSAASAPLVLAPAMNQAMWKNTRTQKNAQALQAQGVHLFGPAEGSQACGDVGPGRMLEPLDILERLHQTLFAKGQLAGKHVVITAGPTREAIDPVRYISNYSSGKMGYALAQAAQEAGAQVTLISGPVELVSPSRVKVISVVSAQEMLEATLAIVPTCDIFFSVAAVADYRVKHKANQKLAKKTEWILELERNTDIVATVAALSPKPFVVGFAAETHDILQHAQDKLDHKKLDLIIANQVGEGIGMGTDDNAVTALWQGRQKVFTKKSKFKLARELIEFVSTLI